MQAYKRHTQERYTLMTYIHDTLAHPGVAHALQLANARTFRHGYRRTKNRAYIESWQYSIEAAKDSR